MRERVEMPTEAAAGDQPTLRYVRSKSCSQAEPSSDVSQRPLIESPAALDPPVKRCENSSGVKSGKSLKRFQTPSLKVIA